MGKGVRKVIPSCALWSIHEKYPLADGSLIPFKEICDHKAKQLYGVQLMYFKEIKFQRSLRFGCKPRRFA